MTGKRNWTVVADSGALTEGAMQAVDVGGRLIAIYRSEGRAYATDNLCTHGQALLTDGWLDGAVVECPLHGGRFEVASGKALCDPVECDLRCHDICERDRRIEVALLTGTAFSAGSS